MRPLLLFAHSDTAELTAGDGGGEVLCLPMQNRWRRRAYERVMSYTNGMRYLGIDYGSKKIGLALSDELGMMGFPYAIVPNTPRLIDELCALIARENVGAVVLGDSRTLAGTANTIAHEARALGEQLGERSGTPVFYESEVFTSVEARRPPEKEMKSRRAKQRSAVDDSAAALILTSYLSRIAHE